MTKNRARKQAARDRAAITGERYVVAQRAINEPLPFKSGRLHELTHRVAGVPAHVGGGLQAVAPRGRNSRTTPQQRARHNEPRVLVSWQNWIARQLHADAK